jgi:hypothetical protein
MERKRVQYQAVTAEGAQRQYAADSAQAAADGWVVETVGWEAASPPMFGATYVHTGAPYAPAWPVHEPPDTGHPGDRARHTVVAAALIGAALVLAAYLGTN